IWVLATPRPAIPILRIGAIKIFLLPPLLQQLFDELHRGIPPWSGLLSSVRDLRVPSWLKSSRHEEPSAAKPQPKIGI
ncbi:MAG: hypothetical protein ACREQA_11045, partial [Candidatus Binatia bacterium]